jgi:hypothetical protein
VPVGEEEVPVGGEEVPVGGRERSWCQWEGKRCQWEGWNAVGASGRDGAQGGEEVGALGGDEDG